jgi:hypothetical protein
MLLDNGSSLDKGAQAPRPPPAWLIQMAFESEASRLRALARRPDVKVWWTKHADEEREKDNIAKLDAQNMLKRCSVSNIEKTDGEECWRAEGKDIDDRRIAVIVVAYEDDPPEIKIITTWAHKAK